jgi:hypothetical protein
MNKKSLKEKKRKAFDSMHGFGNCASYNMQNGSVDHYPWSQVRKC